MNSVKAIDMLTISLPANKSVAASEKQRDLQQSMSTPSKTTILASASSDGMIHVYDLASLPVPPSASSGLPTPPSEDIKGSNAIAKLEPVAKYDTKGTRLTCLTLAGSEPSGNSDRPTMVGVKRRREGSDDEEDEEADGSEHHAEEVSADEEEWEEDDQQEVEDA